MDQRDVSEVPDYQGMLRLDGAAALVAGAGQGMGRQAAHALAQNGAQVLCLDVDTEAAEYVAGEVGGVPVVGDVRDRADIERVLDVAVEHWGRIDHVVDIVGMARWGPFLDTSEEDFHWTYQMVLEQAWHLGQLAGRRMRDQEPHPRTGERGTFAFVASTSSFTAAPLHAAYGVAKAGLVSLVKTMAVELGQYRIRTNAIAPGATLTPRVDALLEDDHKRTNAAVSPLGRMAVPADMASALLYLVAPLSGYVNGQLLTVDSGVHNRSPYPMTSFEEDD